MTADSDKVMLIACCRGDRASQEALVRLYSNLVYSTVLHTYRAKGCHCPDQDLEDLHNTVFLRLLERRCRRLRQFKGKNGCSLASWIRVITVRTVIDHLRQTRDVLSQHSRLASDELLNLMKADTPEPWQLLDQHERGRLLRKGMEALQPRDRLFLKLHCIKELPIREVAQIMKLTENNAYSLKHRAIKRLKAVVQAGPMAKN